MSFSHFDGIYLINLEHRKDRLELANEMFSEFGIKDRVVRVDAEHDLLNGHRGCCRSHIKALKLAKQNQNKCPLILEDDAHFPYSIKETEGVISYFFNQFNQPFDVFLLGINAFDVESTSDPQIKRLLCGQTSHAYAPSSCYIDTLIECFEESYEKMKDDEFFEDSQEKALDQEWKKLQRNGKWYMGKIIAQQRRSYSDIFHRVRERDHSDVV